MVKVGVIGLGKMGLSHLALANAHPDVDLIGICDTSSLVTDTLCRLGSFTSYRDYRQLLDQALDSVIIATPPASHAPIVADALARGIHVFCEKPFCLDITSGEALATRAKELGLFNQVGYHARFIATFQETKRLLKAGLLGTLHHISAEAYGPVVLRTKSSTWRASPSQGGGCLYDYASHVIDLVSYLVGPPRSVQGSIVSSIFSAPESNDEVYSTLNFTNGLTGHIAANWSDDSCRKMGITVRLWGTNGKITVDRQGLNVYVRRPVAGLRDYVPGWNVKFTTELTPPVWFYLRGEEYSAQIAHFVEAIAGGHFNTDASDFASACETDRVIAMIEADAANSRRDQLLGETQGQEKRRWFVPRRAAG